VRYLNKASLCLLFACEKKQKTSQYKGVYWRGERGKWYSQLKLKGGKLQCGGFFEDELNAGKRVNQLCEEFRIPLQNPEINAIPNQQCQVTKKFIFCLMTL
jgi:hypothetical protein